MDWLDIAVHAAVAACVTFGLVTAGVPSLAVAAANAVFWLGRELMQKPDRWRVVTSPQSLLEWLAPALAGVVVAVLA